jgi:hypothetical protein
LRWFRKVSEPLADKLPPAADPDDDVAALLVALTEVDRYINRSAGRLPTPAVVRARWILDTVRDVLDTSERRPLDIQALLTVRGTVHDYLPTTLRGYLALNEAPGVSTPSGRSAAQLLLEQLDTLQEATTRTLGAVRDQDVDALATQGAFLRTKFSRSDLDL